ncbi:hypothetical protein AB0D67_12960 [Streptosporangium sp. NPDC048047]|uniref:hypothetical protein n=1 Tax=unclassified Streptosporangium TaxID=2632669 RepID=UPI0034489932
MASDPDHVLDAIDGVVDEWLTMSEDSMRWAPPEKAPPRQRLGLPAPPLPQIVEGIIQEVGARTQAVVEAVRPLGEGVIEAFAAVLDNSPVRHLLHTGPRDRPPHGPAGHDEDGPEDGPADPQAG